jgi:Tetratricopeptide repeat
MDSWSARPGCIQIVLALSAVLYLVSVWIFPRLNPVVGLVLVILLSAAGGTIVFVVSLRSAVAASQNPVEPHIGERPEVSSVPAAPAVVSPAPTAEIDPLSATRPRAAPTVAVPPPETSALPGASRQPQLESTLKTAPLRQNPRQRMTWLRLARRAAHEAGYLQAEAAHLAELGTAFRHFGQPRRAIVCYQAALTIVRQTGDKGAESTVLGNMGLAYADVGNPSQAANYYEQHLRFVRASGDRPREARASWNLGLAYEELGDLRQAIAAMEVCINYERAIGHPDTETDASLVDQLRARLASETPRRSKSPQSPER